MPGTAPASLPNWVTTIRPTQQIAVDEIVEAFRDHDLVFLDAPVGAGKTLIGEMVRRAMNVRAVYVCSDKALQEQFMRDFEYAALLQGRNNYDTEYGPTIGFDRVTAADCTGKGGEDCMYCSCAANCPYLIARQDALSSDVAVLNTSYLLAATNFVGLFKRSDLVIMDEADQIEGALMGFVEFVVPEWIGKKLKLDYPIKSARKTTIVKWLNDTAAKAGKYVNRPDHGLDEKQAKQVVAFIADCARVAEELTKDIAALHADDAPDDDDNGRWIREYDTRTFAMKPVLIGPYGNRHLWRYGKKFLLMSATIISPEQMVDELGIVADWAVVKVPMSFPVENRQIVLAPVASITYNAADVEYENLAFAIERILEEHPGERVLVHTVSYALTRRLVGLVDAGRRVVVSYDSARDKNDAIARYLATPGAVIFAPSMVRGVDLKGEACRVQIIAKAPFPSFGDKRIGARMRLPGGQLWYSVQTVRDVVQMTGRAVRSETDYAVTYILDKQFTSNLWGKNKVLFPQWWRDAVDSTADVRRFVKAYAAREARAGR